MLEIRDEGIGIPQSDLPRVFDPYFTGENGRRFQESTGMGLFLVKQICDKLGHAFEIESKVDEGTTVRIILRMLRAISHNEFHLQMAGFGQYKLLRALRLIPDLLTSANETLQGCKVTVSYEYGMDANESFTMITSL